MSASASAAADPSVSKTDEKEKTPEDIYFAKVQEVIERCGAEGYMIIRGIERDDNEDDEEDEDEDKDNKENNDEDSSQEEPQTKKRRIIPASKFESFRIVLATKELCAEVKKADDFVTCGQSGDSVQMYNTHSGNTVIHGIPRKTNGAMRRKTLPGRFKALFALTYCLNDTDCWLHDNEYGEEGDECDKAIKNLGRTWKRLLAHSDAELGIDAEYTRPGVEALLEDFADTVSHGYIHYQFPWR